MKNVKWTDEIWKLLTPTPTRENGELLKRLLLGTSIVYGGDTYGKFATGGEDSLTFIAVWDDAFASRSTISVGDSQWTGYRADASERFFCDDQTVTLTVSHPEELLYFQYAVSDQLFENGSVAARKLSFVDYTGTFSTASLNLEEGKPYVIYGFLFTEFKSEIVINTDKIIIDKTAPAITGAKNGDVFCGEGDKTLTVTDRYLDTVTVNGTPVTPNEQGQITLTDARTPQTVVATDKATAYIDVLRDLKVASHESYDSRDRSEGTINRINTVHSLLDSFMARFKGVSTKHLGAYLDWFRWRRTFMATDSRSAESTVARQLANGTCSTRIRDMFNVLPPYMDYWDGRAA